VIPVSAVTPGSPVRLSDSKKGATVSLPAVVQFRRRAPASSKLAIEKFDVVAPLDIGTATRSGLGAQIPRDIAGYIRAWLASEVDNVSNAAQMAHKIHQPNCFLYLNKMTSAVSEQGLPSLIAIAIAEESKCDPAAKSNKRAVGIAQLTKATAKTEGLKISRHNDPRLDPNKAIPAGAKYFSELWDSLNGCPGSRILKTLVLYNGGPNGGPDGGHGDDTHTTRVCKASNSDILQWRTKPDSGNAWEKESSAYALRVLGMAYFLQTEANAPDHLSAPPVNAGPGKAPPKTKPNRAD
jgi:hypothetical protein